MKKSLILIGVFGILVLSGCGDKKIESEADLKACQKEWGDKLKAHCNLFGSGDNKCADIKDEFLKSECGKATMVEKEMKEIKEKQLKQKNVYKPNYTGKSINDVGY